MRLAKVQVLVLLAHPALRANLQTKEHAWFARPRNMSCERETKMSAKVAVRRLPTAFPAKTIQDNVLRAQIL